MGARYLCSRTELFRFIDLDIGNRPLFIGAPPQFLDWLEKLLPGDEVAVQDPSQIPLGIRFRRVLIWSDSLLETGQEMVDSIISHSEEDATYWLIFPMGEDPVAEDGWFQLAGNPFPISTVLQIQRISVSAK
jgi:hypothetical protein